MLHYDFTSHPGRLKKWLKNWPEEVVRAKGVMWVASRNNVGQNISQAGCNGWLF